MESSPRNFASLRLLAGLAAGIAGGLLFGVVMVGEIISRVAILNDVGLVPFAFDSTGGMMTWGIHVLASATFGVVFALAVRSSRLGVTIPLALAYATGIWALGGMLGGGFGLLAFAGHLLYGAGLGLVYPILWREELSMLREPSAARG